MNRADLMRQALRSGDWRSRHEIFRDCGQFFLTNNAASELRARGFTVGQRRKNGQFQYRLLGGAEGNHARDKPTLGSRSSLRSSEQAAPPQGAPSPVRPARLPLQVDDLLGAQSARDLILDRVHDDPAKAADARAYIKGHVEIDDQGCWIWTGALQESGYPIGSACNKVVRAHRLSYTVFVGRIPSGLTLDHTCRVRCCVNPAHLEPATSRENTLRGDSVSAINARKTHCKSGHEYTPQNTRVSKRGKRHCLICEREFRLTEVRRAKQRIYDRTYKARKKAAACSPIQLELETESRFGSGLSAYASGESRAA